MITYQEEKYADFINDSLPIFKIHWEELANHKDIRPLDVDHARYIQFNNMGVLKVFTVRDEGKLVGYFMCTLAISLHYKTWLYAAPDVYYLLPEYRKKGIAPIMFKEYEAWLKDIGVRCIIMQDKITHDHGKFFKQLGYTPVETMYEKVI